MPDTSPKPKTREELEKEWWDRWWAEDYSWEGLAKKNIGGAGGLHGEKTLQHYWSQDPASPLDLNKLSIAELEQWVKDRTDALREQGILVPAPDDTLWHLAHVPLVWKRGTVAKCDWDEKLREKLRDCIADRVAAGRRTDSDKTETWKVSGCDGRALLTGAVMAKNCFRLFAEESNIVHLNCERVWFEGPIDCGVAFGPLARFVDAAFTDAANFENACFLGEAGFNRALFGGTSTFRNVKFGEYAKFRQAVFVGECSFSRAEFRSNVWFDFASFFRRAEFVRIRSLKIARFTKTFFFDSAVFTMTHFAGDARFNQVFFCKDAQFGLATFERNVWFKDANFSGNLRFKSVIWPKDSKYWRKAFEGAFGHADSDFRDGKWGCGCARAPAGFIPYAAFDGFRLGRAPRFSAVSENVLYSSFLDCFGKARDNIEDLVVLEGGCRTLRQLAGHEADKSRERMFYRFELMARNAQSTTPWQERWASRAYEVTSDYGASITQPLMWLLFVWASAALTYVSIGVISAPDKVIAWQWSWDAFDLSLSRTFQPLTLWSAANLQDNALGMELIGNKDRGLLSLCVRATGTLQSLISIILIFLSGLALRRRFQIN